MDLTIEEICLRAQSLPASPTILPKLLELLGNEDANLEDLEGVIATDTGLSGAVLKMANSVYFGGGGRYSDIAQAILHLGFSATHELVMTVAGGRWNSIDLDGYSWEPGDFFRHSYAVAISASIIAKKVNCESPETVYVAGLMHEAGKLALAYASPDSIVAIRIYQEENDCGWLEAERAALGFGHNEITGALLEKWNFPDALLAVGKHYPNPSEAPADLRQYVQIVHVAKHVVIQTGIGVGEDAFWLEAQDGALEDIGLSADELEPILQATLVKIEKVLGDNTLSGEIDI